MLNILVEQNVAASLSQLAPGDVLIEPELGNFSATDFAHGAVFFRAFGVRFFEAQLDHRLQCAAEQSA